MLVLMEMEQQLNETLHARYDGKPLQYGQIIQLMHVRKEMFLAAKRSTESPSSDDDSDPNWIGWHEGSKRCWVKFMPLSEDSDKEEGEKVRFRRLRPRYG